jgi:aspartate kinase
MAVQGAKVIHPRAVEVASRHRLPLKIKGTSGDGEGTLIDNGDDGTIERLRSRVATGLAHRNNYGLLRLTLPDTCGVSLINHLAGNGLEADFISLFQENLVIVADQTDIEAIAAKARKKGIAVSDQIKDCVKISLIGYWSSAADIVSTFVELLSRSKVKALHAFTAPHAVSVIVAGEEAAAALRALHDGIFGKQGKGG